MNEKEKEWSKELDALLGKLVDESLTAKEKLRLNKIMQDEPGAREFYQDYLDIHGALEEILGIPDFSSVNDLIGPETQHPNKSSSITFGNWGLGIAAALVLGFCMQFFFEEKGGETPASIAQISKLSGPLHWTGNGGLVNRNLQVGTRLSGGTIEGMGPDAWLELEFSDGTEVEIAGNSMLTISNVGQKELRLREGSFSAEVKPQPQGKPLLVHTQFARFEVLGTRFTVDEGLSSSTLIVNEGNVRATRLSDGSSVDVFENQRVIAALDRELVAEEMPQSVTIWKSDLGNGKRRNHGEWAPANSSEPAHLKTVPYILPVNTDQKQRTIHTLAMPVSVCDQPPVVLQPESKVRVRGKIESSRPIYFGLTLSLPDGDFAGRFQIRRPALEFKSGEPFDVVLNLTDYQLDPSLAQWSESLPRDPYGLIVQNIWCHTLWDPAGLQVSEIELMTTTYQ
jgi:hypothetical protein